MVKLQVSSEENTKVVSQEDIAKQEAEKLREMAIKRVDEGVTAEQLASEFGMSHKDAQVFSIKRHYDAGHGSIQDYARIYRLDVSEVLEILDQSEMAEISFVGDLIDQDEAGNTPVNPDGEKYKINYDLK